MKYYFSFSKRFKQSTQTPIANTIYQKRAITQKMYIDFGPLVVLTHIHTSAALQFSFV